MRYRIRENRTLPVSGVVLQAGECVELPPHIAAEHQHVVEPVEVTTDEVTTPPVDLTPEGRVAWLEAERGKWAATGLEAERVEALSTRLAAERAAADGAWTVPPRRMSRERQTKD